MPAHQQTCGTLFEGGRYDGTATKTGDVVSRTLVQDHHVRLVLDETSEFPFVVHRAATVASTGLADDSTETSDPDAVDVADSIIEQMKTGHLLQLRFLLGAAEEVVVPGNPDHPAKSIGEGPPHTPNVPRCPTPICLRRGVEVAGEHDTYSVGMWHKAACVEPSERLGEVFAKQLSAAVTAADALKIGRRQDSFEWLGQGLNERAEERKLHQSRSLVASPSRQIAPATQRRGIFDALLN